MKIVEFIPIATPYVLFVGTVLLGMIGWTLRRLISQLDQHTGLIASIQDGIAADRLALSREYPPRKEMERLRDEMREDARELSRKMDDLLRELRK